jgi:LexA-binding, inner membrane-associated putative hydrolase
MAGFRTHVTTSAILGVGYAGAAYAFYDVPLDTSLVAGAMCGFSGMLPDLDSDFGVPLRETMAFVAAIVPMLLVGHFQQLHLTHDAMILAAVSLYLCVRFGITNMIRKYTVHRGMFHSIPACLIFTGLAFLACGTANLDVRCYKAGGVAAGFMSHLVLDEIYAIEWKGGRWRFKKSFGTAIKFWGDDAWANFSTYAKLAIVAMMILAQPSVFEQLEARHPQFAQEYQQLQERFHNSVGPLPSRAQNAFDAARNAASQYVGAPGQLSAPSASANAALPITPQQQPGTAIPYWHLPGQPTNGSIDTAQRPVAPYSQ